MRVFDIRVVPLADSCDLQARVESDADPRGAEWFAPFILWYRFPTWCRRFLSPNNGDAFLAALLPSAMATDRFLEIAAPVSPRLLHATREIQAIYGRFDAGLSRVDIRAPVRDQPLPCASRSPKAGLFFSLGVDTFYSLLKNVRDHPNDEETVSHLIAVHGFDACHGTWDPAFPPTLLDPSGRVARALGKTLLPVATNLRRATGPLAPWSMGHGAGLASVALALGSMFRRVLIAGSNTYDELEPWGTHPVLDPLWATERVSFVHDGCEADRTEKVRFIAQSSLVLDTLRVCPGYTAEYNCGRCRKCLRTMIDLLLADALGRCVTLPAEIDLTALREMLADGHEARYKSYRSRFEALDASGSQAGVRAVLGEALERSTERAPAPVPRRPRLVARVLRRLTR
jgi:hypothetical protein